MKVLDEAFGPTHNIRLGGNRGIGLRTSFPRQPEHLRPYLDAFLAEVRKATGDEYMPPPVLRATWTAGARDLAQVLAEDRAADFMAWAFRQHMKNFPKDGKPYSPKSLIYLVDRYKPNALHNWDSVLCSECFQSPCVCNTWDEDGILSAR